MLATLKRDLVSLAWQIWQPDVKKYQKNFYKRENFIGTSNYLGLENSSNIFINMNIPRILKSCYFLIKMKTRPYKLKKYTPLVFSKIVFFRWIWKIWDSVYISLVYWRSEYQFLRLFGFHFSCTGSEHQFVENHRAKICQQYKSPRQACSPVSGILGVVAGGPVPSNGTIIIQYECNNKSFIAIVKHIFGTLDMVLGPIPI